MSTLDKIRDELFKNFGVGAVCDLDEKDIWNDGFDACLKALTEAGGEFDEQATFQKAIEQAYHWCAPEMRPTKLDDVAEGLTSMISERIDMARWQFEADRAVLLVEFRGRDAVNKLKARLAECERLVEHWRNASVSNFDAGKVFKEKLTAAEARIEELSQFIKDKGLR